MATDKLEFPIGIPVETNAEAAAGSVESLRDQITGSTAEIKALAGTLRQLRGTSDEVKSAKTQLKAKMDALKNSVSSASLALVKQGTTYDAAAARAKTFGANQKKLSDQMRSDAKASSDSMSAALSKAGGPIAALQQRLGGLKSVLGETGGSAGMGLVALGAAGAVAAVAAMVVAVGAAAVALGRFILTSGNALRAAGLLREAWSGTAQNAANLGTQVDALSKKVPTSKAALNELAIALMKSKLSGAATVDTFNAVGQASAALGDEAGGKIKEFIERGRLLNRMRIDPREMLEGFGSLNFDDVAASLAKGMSVSVAAARKALAEGRVKIEDGAKAMRDAVEGKFGGLNLRKMLTFEVMADKLHETFAALTSGVNLEPLLKPLGELGKLFDDSTVTGQTLKMLVTTFGTGMVSALAQAIPLAKAFIQGLVIGGLNIYIAYLKVRNALRGVFGDSQILKDGDALKAALSVGKIAVGLFGLAILMTAGYVVAIAAPFAVLAAIVYACASAVLWTADTIAGLYKRVKGLDWAAVGKAIPDGLLGGLKSGARALTDGVSKLAEDTKKTFKLALGIESPSKVFAGFGANTAEGYAQGVEKGAPRAASATAELGAAPPGGGRGGGGGGGGGGAVVNVTINVNGGGGGEATARALAEPSFLARLTKAIEDALVAQGLPVQA